MASRLDSAREFTAIDLFSGCGGLSCGLKEAGFRILAGIEIDPVAASTYKLNHPQAVMLQQSIEDVNFKELLIELGEDQIDLVAGCPPCQGFSTMRRRNKRGATRDPRNNLILQFLRAVSELKPKVILLENVPALQDYYLFRSFKKELVNLGYRLTMDVLDASHYGVPQRRKRFVMLGSRIGDPSLPLPANDKVTVRDAIGSISELISEDDPINKVHSRHSEKILELISLIPKNGGSRKDLPDQYILECHKKHGIGFHDVYGRMKWDDVSPTITGGCLNPSKGRFLHPEKNRSITAREAALLQTFPHDYRFPQGIAKEKIALMIGNALPPNFAKAQAVALRELLESDDTRIN